MSMMSMMSDLTSSLCPRQKSLASNIDMIWHAKLGLWRVSPSLLVVPDSALADFAANRLEFPTSNNPGLLSNFSKKNVLGHHLQIMILFRNCWMKVNNVNSSVTVLLRIQLQKQNLYRNFYQKLFYRNWPLVAVVAHEIRQQSPKAQGCRHSTGPPRNSAFLYLSCYMSCYTHRIHGAAVYGNIYHQYTPNVSIYTIHGSYGIWHDIFMIKKCGIPSFTILNVIQFETYYEVFWYFIGMNIHIFPMLLICFEFMF